MYLTCKQLGNLIYLLDPDFLLNNRRNTSLLCQGRKCKKQMNKKKTENKKEGLPQSTGKAGNPYRAQKSNCYCTASHPQQWATKQS